MLRYFGGIAFLPRCMQCRRDLVMRILSVCPSVTRVHCDKTVERSVQIYIPYERTFITIKYLGVHIVSGRKLSFDITPVKQAFFAACNSVYAHAKNLDELLHLSLQESYCLPVLTYAVAAVNLSVKQEKELNACWNSVYRKIFGFHKWESVKCCIYMVLIV